MLHPVWPSVYFWYFLGLCSSLLWLFPSMEMEFIKKSTPLVGGVVYLIILISWFGGNLVLSIIFVSLIKNPRTDNFFRGYECVGKTGGRVLVLLGNIGLYYYSEKSIACMLTFLFLGFYCLCTFFYIQPYTDFGVLDFFLTASLTQALRLFGLHIYSWLVFIAVMVLAGLRYYLEPAFLQQPPREVESGHMANADSEGEARGMIEVLQPRREVELERIRSNVPGLRIPNRANDVIDRASERTRTDQKRNRGIERASDVIDRVPERKRKDQKLIERANDVIDRVPERTRKDQKRNSDTKRASDVIDRVSDRVSGWIRKEQKRNGNTKLASDVIDRVSDRIFGWIRKKQK
ncbi:Splicing factor, arginine/serine-rich 7 [Actinidia chinensis var. chinensis]|uniref:Splicing factor, arginine/serine-rich 7 n=1 Tax=Actinidia chinensis var. chinensis TaxID=1590841 RepID=A0A2R6S2N0_ACTCC|nr:Splicing factor, arginine/serine-rich 7 [Actinidia chinensis var. chinensis]